MNSSFLKNLILSAYDPIKTGVFFNGEKIIGSSSDRVYRRLSDTHHELHLQATSQSLQHLEVGSTGSLHLKVHSGSDRIVDINVGNMKVDSLYVEELGCEVPVVVVVLKKQK